AGIDTVIRGSNYFPVSPFDGVHIPEPDSSKDVVMLIDVLHHCDDPESLLREAKRVARKRLVVKDVLNDGFLADITLRIMDVMANRRYHAQRRFSLWSRAKWQNAFSGLDLQIASWQDSLGLYPWPAGLLFERSMHFIADLRVRDTASQSSASRYPS